MDECLSRAFLWCMENLYLDATMKPQLLKRNRKDFLESISYQHVVDRHFLDLWHYHPELELVYVVQSSGNCFIGDAIEQFQFEINNRWEPK